MKINLENRDLLEDEYGRLTKKTPIDPIITCEWL
jgi:hypothetical protein